MQKTDCSHAHRRKPLYPRRRLTLSPIYPEDTISQRSLLSDTVHFHGSNSEDSSSAASVDSSVTDEIVGNIQKWTTCNSHPPQTFSSRKRRRTSFPGSKIHSCTLCARRFTEARSVRRHLMAVHHGEKPFSCDSCGKLFAELGNLKKHQAAVHEGRKPFPCPICGRGFSQLAHMRSHALTVHKKSLDPDMATT